LVAAVPAVGDVPSLYTLAAVVALLWIMVAYETSSYGEERTLLRGRAAQGS
jgi:hypothetical protein